MKLPIHKKEYYVPKNIKSNFLSFFRISSCSASMACKSVCPWHRHHTNSQSRIIVTRDPVTLSAPINHNPTSNKTVIHVNTTTTANRSYQPHHRTPAPLINSYRIINIYPTASCLGLTIIR